MTRTRLDAIRPLPGPRDGGRRHFAGPHPSLISEQERVRIALARFVGGGYVVYALIVIPSMISEAAALQPSWYPPFGAVVAFGPGIALLVAALVPRWQWALPPLTLACTAGLVTAGVLWLVLAEGSAAEPAVWILDFAGLAGLTLALLRPPAESILALAVCKLLGSAVAVVHVADADVWAAIQEALFGIAFSSIFIVLIHQVLRLSADLDDSRAVTEQLVARGLANVELARVDALIHDHVLSTFVAVAADRDDPRVVGQAAAAIEALDIVVDEPDVSVDISGQEAVARLRAVLTGVDGDLPVTVEVSDDATTCPTTVVAALAEAASEAARNSAAHAGIGAQRAVFIGVSVDLVQVVVTDDGVGFDPREVPGDRLGLALSIRNRIGLLPGGDVAVISAPGTGCTVRLRWSPVLADGAR